MVLIYMCGSRGELRNKLLVQADCIGKLRFRDTLLAGMRDVNAAGTDQERFSPSAIKRRNIGCESDDRGGEPIERAKMHGRNEQNFTRVNFRCRPGDCAS